MKCKIDNEIFKINTDRKALLALKDEIIEKCSEISSFESKDVIVVPKRYYGNSELRDMIITESDINGKYNVEAKLYKYPYLVQLIDDLLANSINITNFKFLFNPNNSIESFTIKDKIKNMEELYSYLKVENASEEAKELLLEKLAILLELEKDNELQVNPLEYYESVINCIDFVKTENSRSINFNLSNSEKIKRYIKR